MFSLTEGLVERLVPFALLPKTEPSLVGDWFVWRCEKSLQKSLFRHRQPLTIDESDD
jgi:hypothetical protein